MTLLSEKSEAEGNGSGRRPGKEDGSGLEDSIVPCVMLRIFRDDYLHFGSSYFFFPSYEFLFWGSNFGIFVNQHFIDCNITCSLWFQIFVAVVIFFFLLNFSSCNIKTSWLKLFILIEKGIMTKLC